jgi:hypothetical protein
MLRTELAREAAVELVTDEARELAAEPVREPSPRGGCHRSADGARDEARELWRLPAAELARELAAPPLPRAPGLAAVRRCSIFSSASSWRA